MSVEIIASLDYIVSVADGNRRASKKINRRTGSPEREILVSSTFQYLPLLSNQNILFWEEYRKTFFVSSRKESLFLLFFRLKK